MSGVSFVEGKHVCQSQDWKLEQFECRRANSNYCYMLSISYSCRLFMVTEWEISLLLLEGILVMEKFSRLFGDPFIKMSVPFGTSPLPEMKPPTVIVWGQEEKGMTEDEMAGWHHRLYGCEFEWTPGFGDGQGSLACCTSWGRKELDTTEWLNWTELNGLGQRLLNNPVEMWNILE